MHTNHFFLFFAVTFILISVEPVFAQPAVKIVLITDASGKNASKTTPGGSIPSDLTPAETQSVMDQVNANLLKELGKDWINIVPRAGNEGEPFKIFVSGATRIGNFKDRAGTQPENKETFILEGVLKKDYGTDRVKLINSIVFAIKHELVHLVGGLDNSSHEMEKPAGSHALEFTDGHLLSKDDVSDPANQNYPDPAKDALKKGVEKIRSAVAPNLPPAGPPKPGEVVPVQAPSKEMNHLSENYSDFSYHIDPLLLGTDILNPRFELGLFDASGDFSPFDILSRSSASDPLSGTMTLESGYYYPLVLWDHLTDTFFQSTDPQASLSFNLLLANDSSNAQSFGQILTGDYFCQGFVDYTVSGGVVHVTLDPVHGGDGFTDAFHASPAADVAQTVPEPSSVAMCCAGGPAWLICGRLKNSVRQKAGQWGQAASPPVIS